jgi:hypothetical protein
VAIIPGGLVFLSGILFGISVRKWRMKMINIKFTQEDAEYLAEWLNFVNSKSFGILSEEFKNEVIKADIIRGNLTQLMYENSNWRIKRKYRKGKYSKATIEYVSNKENEDE